MGVGALALGPGGHKRHDGDALAHPLAAKCVPCAAPIPPFLRSVARLVVYVYIISYGCTIYNLKHNFFYLFFSPSWLDYVTRACYNRYSEAPARGRTLVRSRWAGVTLPTRPIG